MPKHNELCTRLENAAAKGDFEKSLWMTRCHYYKLLFEGGCDGEIIKKSKNSKNALVKVCISWKNALEGVDSEKLQEYIEDETAIVTIKPFALKLHIIAYRAQRALQNSN